MVAASGIINLLTVGLVCHAEERSIYYIYEQQVIACRLNADRFFAIAQNGNRIKRKRDVMHSKHDIPYLYSYISYLIPSSTTAITATASAAHVAAVATALIIVTTTTTVFITKTTASFWRAATATAA